MAVICPTITATNEEDYARQVSNVKDFVNRLHIDLMDGQLAPTTSVALNKVWWPDDVTADIHLMYQKPMDSLKDLVSLKPNMVIIHYEAEVDHSHFAVHLRDNDIKSGLALLQDTPVDDIKELINSFDQILVFGGHLGYQGGQADLNQIAKVRQLNEISSTIEIAWDGGINDQNAKQLVEAGVSVLNVGGSIQNSGDPKEAYGKIEASLS